MAQRTTMTLEDDVVSMLEAQVRRSGKPVKQVVNEALRIGLDPDARPEPRPFTVEASDMGAPKIDLTSISRVIDELDGPAAR